MEASADGDTVSAQDPSLLVGDVVAVHGAGRIDGRLTICAMSSGLWRFRISFRSYRTASNNSSVDESLGLSADKLHRTPRPTERQGPD